MTCRSSDADLLPGLQSVAFDFADTGLSVTSATDVDVYLGIRLSTDVQPTIAWGHPVATEHPGSTGLVRWQRVASDVEVLP